MQHMLHFQGFQVYILCMYIYIYIFMRTHTCMYKNEYINTLISNILALAIQIAPDNISTP